MGVAENTTGMTILDSALCVTTSTNVPDLQSEQRLSFYDDGERYAQTSAWAAVHRIEQCVDLRTGISHQLGNNSRVLLAPASASWHLLALAAKNTKTTGGA